MSILGGVMGGEGGGGLLQMAGPILQRVGGIQGLKNMLSSSGLGDQVSSWIGNGENQPVSGEQLGQALEQGGAADLIDQTAQQMGVDRAQAQDQLAQMLPNVVNHMTPDGQPPADDGEGMDLSALSGLAGSLFR